MYMILLARLFLCHLAAVFNFSDNLSPIFKESPCKGSAGNNPGTLGDIVQNLITAFKCSMSQRLKEQLLNYLYKLFVIELGGMHGFLPICAGRFSGQKFKCHENIAARRTCFMVCHGALRDEKMAQLSGFATSARTCEARIVSGHSPPQRLCSLFSFYISLTCGQ